MFGESVAIVSDEFFIFLPYI